jgi:hypothetical protein
MPVKPIVDVVGPAGLFFCAARPNTAWSVSRPGLDADSGVKGEADNGNVKGRIVFEVEASFPGKMCKGDDVGKGEVVVEVWKKRKDISMCRCLFPSLYLVV